MGDRRRGNVSERARGRRPFGRRSRYLAVLAGGAVLAGAVALAHGGAFDGLTDGLGEVGDMAAGAIGLAVQDVTVSGRTNTSAPEILDALGVSRGLALTAVDTERARERVMALEWVREASVMRLYPDTIHVIVEEHEPVAIWQSEEGLVLVDERGVVIGGKDVATFADLPLVLGHGAATAAPAFVKALSQRPSIAGRVRAAVRVGERRWTLKLDNGVDVHLPEEGLEVALDALIGIDQRTGLLARDITMVDMRLPDRVTVLPAGEDGEERGAAGAHGTDRNT